MATRPRTSAPSFGTGAKLIARTTAAINRTERMPPRLSTGSVVSFTWAGTRRSAKTSATTASGSVSRKTEPHQKCSSNRPESSGPERRDRAAERRPERDRLGPRRTRPERRDQRQGRRVRHARGEPTEHSGDEQDGVRWRVRGEEAGRDRERRAEDQHQLPSVPVADRTEVEHRCREPERVPDRDQVQCRLRRVERRPDRGERDVRDRQVQVRDRGHEDQREEDDSPNVPAGLTTSNRAQWWNTAFAACSFGSRARKGRPGTRRRLRMSSRSSSIRSIETPFRTTTRITVMSSMSAGIG